MAQSPSSSSYEDDDDNNIHTNNEESDVQVEKKSTHNSEEQDVVAVKAKKKTNQEEKEDDDEEDNNSKKKNRYKVGSHVNSSKRKLLKNVDDDESTLVNYKKQKNQDSIIVCLSADKQPKTPNSKLNPFGKKWSNDDELVLLQGMVNFKKTHNGGLIDSTPKYEKLLESIKNSLSFAYTNKQLQNKVRSLRDKYETVVHKLMSGGGGENLFENKPHEEQLYNLSKIYWEDMKIIRQKSSKKKNKKSNETPELPYYYLEQLCTINNGSLNSLPITPPLGLVAISVEKGWEESIGKANAVKLNQKVKDLMIAEVEVYLKRCQLMKDTTKLLLDGLKQ